MNSPLPLEQRSSDYEAIGRCAVRSLYAELALSHKPGLVSPEDSGSHSDMDASTFFRSLFSLRSYFREMALAGAQQQCFESLRYMGVSAERRMLQATGGVNTHRGAIFNLGLLSAAAGQIHSETKVLDPIEVCLRVRRNWGSDILAAGQANSLRKSHGAEVVQRYGVGGARAEASSGFSTIVVISLPVYRDVMCRLGDEEKALMQTLFTLISRLQDTNLLYRGGLSGLRFAQQEARRFLDAGGVFQEDWLRQVKTIHARFVARNLSPGGSADLLATTMFVSKVERVKP